MLEQQKKELSDKLQEEKENAKQIKRSLDAETSKFMEAKRENDFLDRLVGTVNEDANKLFYENLELRQFNRAAEEELDAARIDRDRRIRHSAALQAELERARSYNQKLLTEYKAMGKLVDRLRPSLRGPDSGFGYNPMVPQMGVPNPERDRIAPINSGQGLYGPIGPSNF